MLLILPLFFRIMGERMVVLHVQVPERITSKVQAVQVLQSRNSSKKT